MKGGESKVMSSSKKFFLMIAVLVALAFLLTACGGNKNAADQKASATDTSKATKSESTKTDSSAKDASQKEAPKADAAKADAPKADAGKTDAKTEGKADTAKADAKSGAVDATKAKAIMDKASCSGCHPANGKPIDKLGSKYTAAQLTDLFKGKHPVKLDLSDSDLGTLTSYLASLK